MPYKDLEKRKQYHALYNKVWNEQNPERRREITRVSMQKARKEDPEKYAERQRIWRKENPGKESKTVGRYKKRNPEKAAAHRIVLMAKKEGKIFQQPCEICGNIKSQAHHEDYSKPLAVIWLCQKHHSELHRKEK